MIALDTTKGGSSFDGNCQDRGDTRPSLNEATLRLRCGDDDETTAAVGTICGAFGSRVLSNRYAISEWEPCRGLPHLRLATDKQGEHQALLGRGRVNGCAVKQLEVVICVGRSLFDVDEVNLTGRISLACAICVVCLSFAEVEQL